jgi:hypothetical protein
MVAMNGYDYVGMLSDRNEMRECKDERLQTLFDDILNDLFIPH